MIIMSLILPLLFTSCSRSPQPPVAEVIPHRMEIHGHTRTDNYFWLKERDNPEVIAYLEAENEYTNAMMRHTSGLQDQLFTEIKDRIQKDDSSVPYLYNGYYYYHRFMQDKEYRIYCRKNGALSAPEEIVLDCNALAAGHDYFSVSGNTVSPDGTLYAFAVDTVGRRKYSIRFKNLDTGQVYDDLISDVTRNFIWANDNQTLFYTKQDPETLRWDRIYKHRLGTDVSEDRLVYEEMDVTFDCAVTKTKSDDYILIDCTQTVSTEVRYLNANNPDGEFIVIQPRERDHEYSVKQLEDTFYITTNWNALNFRLMKTSIINPGKENWREIIPHRPDVLITDCDIFGDYLVLTERADALNQIRIIPWSGAEEHYLDFGEPVYMAYTSGNMEFNTPLLRFRYSSLTTPSSTYDYNMKTRERTLLKQDKVLGGYSPADYVTERLYAPAADGTQIPISIVYPREMIKNGKTPLLLYAYGAYGYSTHATFSTSIISLLERGFAYAIAHVRGGQEMGRAWYEEGRLLHKKNSFTDFIACGEYLVAEGYTNSDHLFCEGGSAGGLLIGAVVNMAPDLFKGAIAEVPFVDVMTTMLDSSIPLTTSEYDEWGNPNDEQYYDYMLSYSPYDQVKVQSYCNLLVLTGLHDSQVQYWEPAKWVARLRAQKTDTNRLLLHTNMAAGHGGASGRFEYYREIALAYAFMIDLVGGTE